MTDQYTVTKEGLEQLKEELKTRSGEKRQILRDTLEAMKGAGDLSENEGYTLTKDEIQLNESRISELQVMISNAVISKAVEGKVRIGSEVKLEGEDKKTYKIVGEEETNPLEGKISHLSPLGEKLINKKVGDIVKFSKPNGDEITYKITEINN
jgi:transcription elongation factor GreA